MKWVDKKIFICLIPRRHAPANPFMRFAGACLRGIRQIRDRSFPFLEGPNRRSLPRVFLSSHSWLDKKTRGQRKESDLRSFFTQEKRSSIFFSVSPKNSMNFRGTRPLPSKIACDFRRQRSVFSDSRV